MINIFRKKDVYTITGTGLHGRDYIEIKKANKTAWINIWVAYAWGMAVGIIIEKYISSL
jgi:hypothetical protein